MAGVSSMKMARVKDRHTENLCYGYSEAPLLARCNMSKLLLLCKTMPSDVGLYNRLTVLLWIFHVLEKANNEVVGKRKYIRS